MQGPVLNAMVHFDEKAIAGDFNHDNMSPADSAYGHRPLFKEFTDVCMVKPGSWTFNISV